MDIIAFTASLDQPKAPDELDASLRALWEAAKGNWEKAHALVQDEPNAKAAWVHAYLHRFEGDTYNADYWYHRAGKLPFEGDFKSEWEQIVEELLNNRL